MRAALVLKKTGFDGEMRTVFPMLRAENGQNGPARVLLLGREAAADVQKAVAGLAAEIWMVDSVDELLSSVDEGSWGCLVADSASVSSGEQGRLADFLATWPSFPLIVWSPSLEIRSAVESIKHGALEALRSPQDESLLPTAISDAIRTGREKHEQWRSSREVARRFHLLSANERSVLALVLQGQTNKEISTRLDFSLRTVEARRQRILRTMQSENAIDLAVLLCRQGLVDEALKSPSQPEGPAQSASA
jgi:two-component system response regulator FixJ